MNRALAIPAFFSLLMVSVPASAETVVPVRHFEGIELRGGGHVILKYGNRQQVTLVSGSMRYTRFTNDSGEPGKLVIDTCNSECPWHYDMEVVITSPSFPAVAISGGGAIDSQGNFPGQRQVTAAVNGGGHIDIRSIGAASATAAVDGGGKILLRTRDELTASINGGGHIEYWGSPRNVTKAIDGGGEVSQGG